MSIDGNPLAVYSLPDEDQHLWSLQNLLEAFYPTTKTTKRKEKWQSTLAAVMEVHKKMWPDVEPRKPRRVELDDSRFSLGLTTTMMFAFLVWGLTAPKRSSVESKKICEGLLQDILRLCCETEGGWSFDFSAVHLDCQMESRPQTVGSDMIIDCWTPAMSDKIALLWDSAILDDKKRIPTSTRTRTAVSDYVLWSLEPVPLNHKDQVIRECREALAPSALQVVMYQHSKWTWQWCRSSLRKRTTPSGIPALKS